MLPDITYVPRGAQLFRVVNHHCGEWSLIVGVELKTYQFDEKYTHHYTN
jgi:hypothetical protein